MDRSSKSLMESIISPIEVVEECQIAPCCDSPESATKFSLPLTFFDIIWLKFNPSERVYFYQPTESSSSPEFFYRVILPKLKQSLSVTLCHFLPLAGRLTWPSHASKPSIHYVPNDTVSLTVAESDADFNRLSSNDIRDTIESRPYVPELQIADSTSPVIALQITLFPDSGYSIGYSTHHATLDGRSITLFMKAWAHICREPESDLPQELTPSFDRTVVKDPEGLDMVYSNHWIEISKTLAPDTDPRSVKPFPGESITKSKLFRATFVLTGEDIKRLRDWVLSIETIVDQLRLSSFVLTYAYTLVCIVESMGEEKVSWVHFIFASDCRTRLDSHSIPKNYFGNCIYGYDGFVDAKALMDKNGVILMAKKISELVKEANCCGLEGAKEALEKWTSGKPKTLTIGIAGSPRFELYEVDFGWGRPKKVEVISIDKNRGIAMERSRDGDGGIEVGVVLEKHEMEVFASLFVNGLKELHY
ncbi:hypothetical protein HS088_TW23G00133 [Tripterygium wilfordii]|uniref:Phenolic glucoside malonyltransferase 1-like n=1 Tax=Tripterygium wilfordii TaxID=458696 RepID=A0A7J7BTZ8_TRIWF|nr:malonyl-CoA:anthocyanidin 5-O-glucoside-6''-O-malonyltransferase-like [Tripterygium wilfordii]KAF5725411.1 hypothetical protein HS088_TW23G00133 [Tripterygium wilfordii]